MAKEGIKYWRDIRDATAGKLEKQVNKAMRENPIFLLILSQHSTNSDWVEIEAAKARKLEKELGKDVFCPIAIDDTWKHCDWPERLRIQIEKYNILDFSNWENEKDFHQMFTKLLRGLDLYYKEN